MAYSSEDFERARENYRRDFHVPEGETDILLGALQIASRVTREGGAVEKTLSYWLPREAGTFTRAQVAAAIRRALIEEGGA